MTQHEPGDALTARRSSGLREAYQQSIFRKLVDWKRRASSARENSNQDSLHDWPSLKLSQSSRSHDPCGHGRCQDQLLTWNLRRTPEEHQINQESQSQSSPTSGYPSGPAGSEAQSRKARPRADASPTARHRNADNQTVQGKVQDPCRLS